MKTAPPAVREELARKIVALMHDRGIKDNGELARRIEKAGGTICTRQMVHKWVTGLSYPTEHNRRSLAQVLGVPVSELTYDHAGHRGQPIPLSNQRVPFRWTPDTHNPALVRAEMSDVLTIDQAERIAVILGMSPKK